VKSVRVTSGDVNCCPCLNGYFDPFAGESRPPRNDVIDLILTMWLLWIGAPSRQNIQPRAQGRYTQEFVIELVPFGVSSPEICQFERLHCRHLQPTPFSIVTLYRRHALAPAMDAQECDDVLASRVYWQASPFRLVCEEPAIYGKGTVVSTDTHPTKHAPLTEEEMRAATVGDLVHHASTIDLHEYSDEWPRLYEREAARVRQALGGTVLMLEHVGSTSVPGLAAKPIIDMLLIVPDSSNEASYRPALERAGYVLRIREPEWHQHRLFKGPDTNINLHVFSEGSTEIERMVGFRDWLRTHDDDRLLYEQTKRELAIKTWKYVQNYADAKTVVVEEIVARAGLAERT
jgi:GrpB-like predicted nucleotidyltransferase (UPF0157 family)